MSNLLHRFQIIGLFGNRNVDIYINSEALILVGPNGIGKSSVVNIFYFFITRQWQRLGEYEFSEVCLWLGEEEIRVAKADITGLSQLDRLMKSSPVGSRIGLYIKKINEAGLLEDFISGRRLSQISNSAISNATGLPVDEIRPFRASVIRRLAAIGDDLFATPRISVESKLSEKFRSRALYLPTYRRIEKDIQEIFPDAEERLRLTAKLENQVQVMRSAKHYVDLVSFGMEDVKSNVEAKTRSLRDYSLDQFNELSGRYLRDVIKGTADQYSPSQIAALDEISLSTILGRVSEEVLPAQDKDLLRSKIIDIKGKQPEDLKVNEKYLAHYFSRLMSVSADISKQESEISKFVDVCNAYLAPGKQVIYDETRFSVKIIDGWGKEIDMSVLSSGEKQVVSLFSHLYLDDSTDQIVIIDEPELSLSVPWQKRFLTDIIESSHCNFVLSVTHSPFIYQNRLSGSAVDLRQHITVYGD